MTARRKYSLDQLVLATGVPRDTIRWWIRNKWVDLPHGKGPKRYYTEVHRDRIIAIKELRRQQRTTGQIADYLDNQDDGRDDNR